MSKTDLRILGATFAVAIWLSLLFTGWAFGGFVHALLVIGFFLVPWRAIPRSSPEIVDGSEQTVGQGGRSESDQESMLGKEASGLVEDQPGT